MLKEIFKKWFCCHDWETIKVGKCYRFEDHSTPYKITYILTCKKCGKIKEITIYG